ncbi:MAG: hypothetical protein KDK37_09895, partial [Leptospiraceae bacterium]|nr:hypothetical protein [Leptospiraceae bacterium]
MLTILIFSVGIGQGSVRAEPQTDVISTDTVARYISGMPVEEASLPAALRNLPEFRAQRQFFEKRWAELEPERLGPMRSWAASELSGPREAADTLFYPFGGPDFL